MAAHDDTIPSEAELREALSIEAVAASAHLRCSTTAGHCSYRRHALAVVDSLLDDLLPLLDQA